MKIRVFLMSLIATAMLSACADSPRSADQEFERAADALRELPGTLSVTAVAREDDPAWSDDEGPGYQRLGVVHHESQQCDAPSRECGAVLEVWPDAEAALDRLDRQAAMAAVEPGFGSAIAVTAGRVVVFVDPALSHSARQAILEEIRALR